MSPCEAYAALLDAFLDGELTAEQAADVQRHLDGCAACRAYTDDILAIRAELPDIEDTKLPPGFTASVMEAVARTPQARPKRQPWGKLAAAAACLAVIVLLQKAGLPGGIKSAGSGASLAAPAAAAPMAPVEGKTEAAMDAAAGGIVETAPVESPETDYTFAEERAMESSGSTNGADGESIVDAAPAEAPAASKENARNKAPALTLLPEAAGYLADYAPFEETAGEARYELTPEAYAVLLQALPDALIVPPVAPTAAGERVVVALLK